MNIAFSPDAISDLIRLREFIEIKNPQAARRVARLLQKNINQLMKFPKLGKAVAESHDPEKIRDLISNNYTVRYLIGNEMIFILRIWHQREDK